MSSRVESHQGGGIFVLRVHLAGWCVTAAQFLLSMGVGAALGLGLFLSPLFLTPSGCLLPNVQIDEYPVGGCGVESVRSFLNRALSPAKLWIVTPPRTWSVPLDEVGGTLLIDQAIAAATVRDGEAASGALDRAWECWQTILFGRQVPVRVAWKPGPLGEYLRRLAWATNESPQNAELHRINGVFLVSRSAPGRRMDIAATVREITRHYSPHQREFRALYTKLPPRRTETALRCKYELLGSFTTRFPAYKRNRTKNLSLALAKLRGAVILPGETFSFNARVGERTGQTGFVVADIFVNHEVVPGIGGGVCQVSTTLYNAARRAKLRIVERHRHSLPVTYVAVGRDATVAYGGRDLKLRNGTPNPVYVDGRIKGNALTIELWGNRRPRSESPGNSASIL